MPDFVRVLEDGEAKLLAALDKPSKKGCERPFWRQCGTDYKKTAEKMMLYEKNVLPHAAHDALEYCASMRWAFLTVDRFLKGEAGLSDLSDRIDRAFASVEGYGQCFGNGDYMNNLLIWIREMMGRISAQDMPEHEKPAMLIKQLELIQKPRYIGLDQRCKMAHAEIDRLARGLQGIVSIKLGSYGQYRDVFVPCHLYEDAVLPALDGQEHRFVRSVAGEHLETLRYACDKTRNLRKRYGNRFRPEFTRPEICREFDLGDMALIDFRHFMEALEGVMGRLERHSSFYAGGYTVYYEQPSWFLPYRHQRMLEEQGFCAAR